MKALLAFLLAPVIVEQKTEGPCGMQTTLVYRLQQPSIFFAADWSSDEIDAATAIAEGHADKIEVRVQPSAQNGTAQ